MENFNDFLASYWQETEAGVLPLSKLVEHYFKSMPSDRNKNAMLTTQWDATKHLIVKGLLRQERLYKISTVLGPFKEPVFDRLDKAANSHVYIHWNELYVQL